MAKAVSVITYSSNAAGAPSNIEEVYLKAFATVNEAKVSLQDYLRFTTPAAPSEYGQAGTC